MLTQSSSSPQSGTHSPPEAYHPREPSSGLTILSFLDHLGLFFLEILLSPSPLRQLTHRPQLREVLTTSSYFHLGLCLFTLSSWANSGREF